MRLDSKRRRRARIERGAIRDALAKAFVAQVKRGLETARVAGRVFPRECDIGIQVTESTARSATFTARIDDVNGVATVEAETVEKDVIEIVEQLTRAWLDKKATRRPAT